MPLFSRPQAGAQRQTGLRRDLREDELAPGQGLLGQRSGDQHRLFQRQPIEAEPAGVTPFELRGHPLPLGGVPDDLGEAVALADAVEHVEQLVRQLVALQPVADHVGDLDIGGIVRRGFDRDIQLADRPASGAEDTPNAS